MKLSHHKLQITISILLCVIFFCIQNPSYAYIVPNQELLDPIQLMGPEEITEGFYKFKEATENEIFYGQPQIINPSAFRKIEIWAQVYRPKTLAGSLHPLIFMMPGNHGTCRVSNHDLDGPYVNDGTCPNGDVVRSQEGYAYTARHLASWGYIVVSINANRSLTTQAPNPYPYLDDGYFYERGRLFLKHMELWHLWSQSGAKKPSYDIPGQIGLAPNGLEGVLDFQNVGLLGHSRTGQAARAAYDLYYNYASFHSPRGEPNWPNKIPGLVIKGIFELAPTDYGRVQGLGPVPVPSGASRGVMVGTCDPDIFDLQGVFPYDRGNRLSVSSTQPTNNIFYALLTVWRANHRNFNSVWADETYNDPSCLDYYSDNNSQKSIIDKQSQQDIADEAIVLFFRATVGASANPNFQKYFIPSYDLPSNSALATKSRVERSAVRANASNSTQNYVWDDFNPSISSLIRGSNTFCDASRTTNSCAPITIYNDTAKSDGTIWGRHDSNQYAIRVFWDKPNNSPAPYIESTNTGSTLLNASTMDLSFRVSRIPQLDYNTALSAEDFNISNKAGTNFTIKVVDQAQQSAEVQLDTLTSYSTISFTELKKELIGPPRDPSQNGTLPILREIRIPLSKFKQNNASLDVTNLRKVIFVFDQTPKGAVYLANIRFAVR